MGGCRIRLNDGENAVTPDILGDDDWKEQLESFFFKDLLTDEKWKIMDKLIVTVIHD